MGLLECASGASIWRGYDYYANNKVQELECISDTQFRALVVGNASVTYTVEIDTAHIRKSKCNCPHANGRRIICKHMIAVFFTAFPEQAQEYYQKVVLRKEQEEQEQEEQADELVEYVHSMTNIMHMTKRMIIKTEFCSLNYNNTQNRTSGCPVLSIRCFLDVLLKFSRCFRVIFISRQAHATVPFHKKFIFFVC